jgi:hypothetical protein
VPVALDRAIRFAAGTRLVFLPALGGPLLAVLAQVKPQYKALLDGLSAVSCAVESIDVDRCILQLVSGDATSGVRIERDSADTYAVTAEYRARAGDAPRVAAHRALVIMLGGASEVFLAERDARGVRYWLKLRYGANRQGVSVSLFTAEFAARLPAALRALAPSELELGSLRPEGAA